MGSRTFALHAAVLLVCACAVAQTESVADAAAASRANKKSTTKTITNDDVKPTDSASNDGDDDAASGRSASSEKFEGRAAQVRWRVLRLKQQIKSAQARLDQLKQQRSLRESRFSAYNDNERQWYYARFKQAELQSQNAIASTQERLDQLNKQLADLQEQARKEGFGNSVYEPD